MAEFPRSNLEERQINTFIVPPSNSGQIKTSPTEKDYSNNPVFEQGSNLTLAWDSNYTTIILDFTQDLLCDPGVTPCGLTSTLYESPTDPSTYVWTVDPKPYNIAASHVFYFVMYNRSVSNTSSTFTSHYFNISANDAAPSSTSSSASNTATPSIPSITSSPATNVPSSLPPTELSSGIKVGIGLGAAALVLLGLISAILWLRYRTRGHDEPSSWTSARQELDSRSVMRHHELEDQQLGWQKPVVHEVSNEVKVFELHGNERG